MFFWGHMSKKNRAQIELELEKKLRDPLFSSKVDIISFSFLIILAIIILLVFLFFSSVLTVIPDSISSAVEEIDRELSGCSKYYDIDDSLLTEEEKRAKRNCGKEGKVIDVGNALKREAHSIESLFE